MPVTPRRIKWDTPEFWERIHGSKFEPHWAIKILLHFKGKPLPEVVEPGEYPVVGLTDEPVTPERALGWFDKECPGWVPLWFPKGYGEKEFSPIERLALFDRVLEHSAVTGWPPRGTFEKRQKAVALALLHMLWAWEESDGEAFEWALSDEEDAFSTVPESPDPRHYYQEPTGQQQEYPR